MLQPKYHKRSDPALYLLTSYESHLYKMYNMQADYTATLLKNTIDSSMDMIQVFEAVRNEHNEIVDFIWILNNKASEAIYGNVIGESLLTLNPGVVEEGIFDTFKQVVATGIHDQRIRHYVHEQFNGWFHQSTVKQGDGVTTTTKDISAIKKAEQEILELKDEIAQRAEGKYRTLFQSIDEGYLLADVIFNSNNQPVDILFVEANPAATRIAGRDFTSRRMREIDPDYEEYWFDVYCKVAATGEPVRAEQYSKPHNRWFDFHVSKVEGSNSHRVAVLFQDITERKYAEESVRKSEARFRRMFTNNMVPMFMWTPNGATVDANDAFLTLIGYTHEELQEGRCNWDIITPPRMEQRDAAAVAEVMVKGLCEPYEKVFRHKDGQEVPFLVGAGVFEHDPFIGVCFAIDITERKQNEEIVRSREERLRGVLDGMGEAFGLLAPDFTILEHNREALRMDGRSREEIVGRLHWEVYPESEHSELGQLLKKAMAERVPVSLEHPYAWEHNRALWLEMRAYPTADGLLAVFWRDVTERRNAQDALRESEKKYRTLFDTMDEALAICEVIRDDTGKVVDLRYLAFNNAHRKQTGLDPDKLIGRYLSDVLTKADVEKWIPIYGRIANSRNPESFEDYVDLIDRWYVASVYPDSEDKLSIFYRDITERKQREQHQQFLIKFSDALRAEPDGDAIANSAVRMLAGHLRLDRCYVGIALLEDNRGLFPYQFGNDRVAPMPEHGVILSDFPEALRKTFGETLVITDFQSTEGLTETEKQNFAALGFGALVVANVRKQEKNPHWSINAVSATPRRWSASEVQLVEEATERTWAAVERARAEQALRGHQQRLESIANLVPDLLWDSEPDGSTNWYNHRWLEYTGQSFEQAIGWGWVDAIHPNDREGSAKRYQRSVEKGQALRQEHRIRRVDGAYRWFVVNTFPLTDANGGVIKVYGSATDIHESRLMTEALHASEARLRTLSDAVPQIIWANDPAGVANYFNQRWYEYSGLSFEESHALGWQAIVHPDDAPASAQLWQDALAAQSIFDTEYRLRNAFGDYRWHIGRTIPLFAAGGELQGWFGSATDIDDLKQAKEDLIISEERYRVALQSAAMAAWDWDIVNDVVEWNDQHFYILALQPGNQIKSAGFFLQFVHPDDVSFLSDSLRKAVEETGVFSAEFRVVRADKQTRWMSGYGRAVNYDSQRKITRMVGVMYDITAHKGREKLRDEFIGVASHELKTPVTSMKIYAEIVQERLEAMGNHHDGQLLSKLNAQIDRLYVLINHLLDTTKIAEGQLPLVFGETDLNELLRERMEELRLTSNHRMELQEHDLPPIVADRERIGQVITNLLSNAIKYSPKGTIIMITSTGGEKGVTVSVRDEGYGIPPADVDRVFDRFFRVTANKMDTFPGMGLGLYIIAQIIHKHKGWITVQSELGKGSTFSFFIPYDLEKI